MEGQVHPLATKEGAATIVSADDPAADSYASANGTSTTPNGDLAPDEPVTDQQMTDQQMTDEQSTAEPTTAAPVAADAEGVEAPAVETAPGPLDVAADDAPNESGLVGIGPSLGVPGPPAGWSDPLTGTDGPRYWDRLISSERARVKRYHRPVTVGLVELVGLNRLARQWGNDVAERTLAQIARTLAHEIRTSDHIARIETGRFGILLTETDEIAAINFIERARASCDRELVASSDLVRIAFGWASPGPKGDLADALNLAFDRLTDDSASVT